MSEWKEFKYGDIISIKSKKIKPEENKGMKCIELEHLSQETGRILGSIEVSGKKSIKNYFEDGDVLFGKLRPYLQKYAMPNFKGACSSEIWVMKPNNSNLYNKYLYYIVQSKSFIDLANNSTGSKMPRADWTYISDKTLEIPPFLEQKMISKILSTWDDAIEVQNRLIIEKKSFLENLSLALVKNHRSLSSSTTSWKLTPLSDVFKENKEFAFENESLKLYSLTIEDGVTPKTDRYNREFLVKGGSKKYKVTKFHDLVFNPQNLRYGAIALNENENPVLLSPIYATMEVKNKKLYDIHYFTHLLTSKEMIKYYDSIAEGTLVERMSVKPDVFLKQEFMIPPYEEQKKISTILNEIKTEIILLEQELEYRKLQKKGLMQQLLTGKIRVNVN